MKKLAFLLLITLQISNVISESQLSVVSPPKLIQILNSQNLNHTIANFGHVPYGRKLMGKVYKAVPSNACGPLTPFPNHDPNENIIVLVERGVCTFVTKSRYSQIIGASMVLVIDTDTEDPDSVLMADDGNAAPLKIPTFLISRDDGNKISNFIDNTQDSIVISASFKSNKGIKVKTDLWISFAHLEESLTLIYQTKKIWEELKNYMNIIPHYYTHDCTTNCVAKNCLINGTKYCHPDPDKEGPSSGSDIVMEILNQLCIFQDYGVSVWFDYIIKAKEECGVWEEWPSCNDKIMENLQIKKGNIENCINLNYVSNRTESILLKKQRTDNLNRNYTLWPSLTFNEMEFFGNHYYQDIGEAVCSELIKTPDECKSYKDSIGININIPDEIDTINWGIVWVTATIMIIVFFVMIYVFRRMVKRNMREGVNFQVNEAVSQYLALQDSEKIKKDDEAK